MNERLFEADLMSEFSEAAKERNKIRMVDILKEVELTEAQANETAAQIIQNPFKYGY